MQTQLDVVLAQRAQRMFEMNLLLVDGDFELVPEFVRNRAGSDRTEHLAFFAGLHVEDERHLRKGLGQFAHGVELMGFALGAALAQRFETPLVRRRQRNRKALRKKIVARVTGGDLHLVGLGAETNHLMSKNDFSFCHTQSGALIIEGSEASLAASAA